MAGHTANGIKMERARTLPEARHKCYRAECGAFGAERRRRGKGWREKRAIFGIQCRRVHKIEAVGQKDGGLFASVGVGGGNRQLKCINLLKR